MEVFNTAVLDQTIAGRQEKWETERQALLARLLAWLDENATDYGVTQAYIFGSLAQPGRFSDHSDFTAPYKKYRASLAIKATVGA